MHEDRISTARADAQAQAQVLNLVLGQSPHQLSKVELLREIVGESPEFEQRDRFERAIEDLVRAGLLREVETMVSPTKAARHFYGLMLG